MTRCFEPDSIDLIKPLAVDEGDDVMDIIILTISPQYSHIDLCASDLKHPDNRTGKNRM
jgi:hypothetical protein